jgi:hypothetical protein
MVALAALFVALGGSSYAALRVGTRQIVNNSVRSVDVRNGTLRGKDSGRNTYGAREIRESDLGEVPRATLAGRAALADRAALANTLGGRTAAQFAPAGVEAVHVIGASGQPAFGQDWSAVVVDEVPGFWKDPYGTVHLRGALARAASGNQAVMFTLPPGYRPRADEFFPAYANSGTFATVWVRPDGTVNYNKGDDRYLGLGGITFRADH